MAFELHVPISMGREGASMSPRARPLAARAMPQSSSSQVSSKNVMPNSACGFAATRWKPARW